MGDLLVLENLHSSDEEQFVAQIIDQENPVLHSALVILLVPVEVPLNEQSDLNRPSVQWLVV